MCGIFGYLNWNHPVERRQIVALLTEGLSRLEYRGYDSAGVAFDAADSSTVIVKMDGNVSRLRSLLETSGVSSDMTVVTSHIGIAHTRWATHGDPSPINSHPQRSDPTNQFVIVHNGIITNYRELKQTLIADGYEFESDTDTEVFAKLIKFVYDEQSDKSNVSLVDICKEAVSQIHGSYAFLVKSRLFPGEIVATRQGSPLIIGVTEDQPTDTIPLSLRGRSANSGNTAAGVEQFGEDSFVDGLEPHLKTVSSPSSFGASGSKAGREYFFSSDATAIVQHTSRVLYLEDRDVAHVKNGVLKIYNPDFAAHPNSSDGAAQPSRAIRKLAMQLDSVMKGQYEHFMQKEILEQPESLLTTMRGRVKFDSLEIRLGGIIDHIEDILTSRRVIFLACGTSYNACLAAQQVFEELSNLPVTCELASEFVDRKPNVFRDEIYIYVSQSGETADTLRALQYVKKRGALTCGVTNTVGSAIARSTDFGVHVNAGVEIGVASTKAYTCQIIAIILIALQISGDSVKKTPRRAEIMRELERLPRLVDQTIKSVESVVKQVADELIASKSPSVLVFGRGYQYATALEGALKIKEISYIHSEGLSSSELKHGPIALISADMPSILICTRDELFPHVMSALEQVCARHGNVIAICNEGDEAVREKAQRTLEVPKIVDCLACVLNVIPLQLLSYHLAVKLGRNVDQPRNLAKSVVV
eukprot:ANDGO_03854.mRNA.1 Glutamine--fructose-6-phosphate aminotransferase